MDRRQSESSISYKISPMEFAGRLSDFDVISFDVFGTLIFRPFSDPYDLFLLLEKEFLYPDFSDIRQKAEKIAREKKYCRECRQEVNLKEIYDVLKTDLDKRIIMARELELERQLCFGNPYMQIVTSLLAKKRKRMIITSDLYLETEQVRLILESCGYPEFGAYYVSCDAGASKCRGDLYDLVRECEGNGKLFVHVGDHEISDAKNAGKHGFAAEYYPNVNAVGEKYRPHDMSAITGSIYRGLVNAHIHNGLLNYSCEYEYGYIYGGLPVTGYCQFIHDHMGSDCGEKPVLLPGMEGVLSMAYQILYPRESCHDVIGNNGKMTEIWDGVLEFVRQWKHYAEKIEALKHIGKSDAYAPIRNMCG